MDRCAASSGVIVATSDLSWVKVSVALPRNSKVRQLPPAARWLYVALLCYCGEQLNDGVLDDAAVAHVVRHERARSASLARLIEVGLLTRVHSHYVIPQYLEWNRSRMEVETKRQANASRMRNVRAHERAHDGADADDRARAHDELCAQQREEGEGEGEMTTSHHQPLDNARHAQAGDDGEQLSIDELVSAALDVLAQRDVDEHVRRGGRVTATGRFLQSCRAARERDSAAALYTAAHAHPACSPAELADLLGRASGTQGPPRPAPSPLDSTAAAQHERFERTARRENGEACPKCNDVGMWLDDDDVAHECPCRYGLDPFTIESTT